MKLPGLAAATRAHSIWYYSMELVLQYIVDWQIYVPSSDNKLLIYLFIYLHMHNFAPLDLAVLYDPLSQGGSNEPHTELL